jgi:hypothetical protein
MKKKHPLASNNDDCVKKKLRQVRFITPRTTTSAIVETA